MAASFPCPQSRGSNSKVQVPFNVDTTMMSISFIMNGANAVYGMFSNQEI